jgi:hypothetical protein
MRVSAKCSRCFSQTVGRRGGGSATLAATLPTAAPCAENSSYFSAPQFHWKPTMMGLPACPAEFSSTSRRAQWHWNHFRFSGRGAPHFGIFSETGDESLADKGVPRLSLAITSIRECGHPQFLARHLASRRSVQRIFSKACGCLRPQCTGFRQCLRGRKQDWGFLRYGCWRDGGADVTRGILPLCYGFDVAAVAGRGLRKRFGIGRLHRRRRRIWGVVRVRTA